MIKWKDRTPYAFWKGNLAMADIRRELGKCNPTKEHDWNARIHNIVIYNFNPSFFFQVSISSII